jgi:hypothetical protein
VNPVRFLIAVVLVSSPFRRVCIRSADGGLGSFTFKRFSITLETFLFVVLAITVAAYSSSQAILAAAHFFTFHFLIWKKEVRPKIADVALEV